MDIQMPGMNGMEVTRSLRQLPYGGSALPVIAMTANAMAGDREKCLQAGMNDHITKPINVDEMFSTMARWIEPASPAAAVVEETPVQDDSFPVPPIEKVIGMVLLAARTTNPDCFCAGISVNTSALDDAARTSLLGDLEERYALPCVDPIATGMGRIADRLLEETE